MDPNADRLFGRGSGGNTSLTPLCERGRSRGVLREPAFPGELRPKKATSHRRASVTACALEKPKCLKFCWDLGGGTLEGRLDGQLRMAVRLFFQEEVAKREIWIRTKGDSTFKRIK